MKKLLSVLAILATAGVFAADFLLLGVTAFRNGWASLALFAAPAALLVLASLGGEPRSRAGVAAWVVFALGLSGYVAMRLFTGNVAGTPAVAEASRVPDFTLKDQDGRQASLDDFLKKGRVLLVFFRGAG